MATAKPNKPLIDLFFDRGVSNDFGIPMDFAKNAPRDKLQTFVLSPEVALSAEMMVRSKTFKMPGLSELRMPYPHVAIEYPLTEGITALRSSGINGVQPITRVGAYVHAAGEGNFLCMPYWEYDTGLLQHSLFMFELGGEDPESAVISLGPNPTGEGAVKAHLFPCLSFIDAAERSGITKAKLEEIMQHQSTIQHIRESAVEIPCLVFACSLLLNCKSGVGRTQVPAKVPPKGLKLGGKKQKAYSASAYTLLHLEEIETVTTEGSVNRRTDISAHYVRGHFKQRKSGIYWWNSFVRGHGKPRARVAYLVEGTA